MICNSIDKNVLAKMYPSLLNMVFSGNHDLGMNFRLGEHVKDSTIKYL